MFVLQRFELEHKLTGTPKFGYNGFGELVFYRTYSRKKPDGKNESWNDCVKRVVEGTFSIRKDWYLKNHISWDEKYWQDYAAEFAESMFKMEWLPPGRGLWAMGTDFIYKHGSMALYNCGAIEIKNETLTEDICWAMDALMLGVGVGFSPTREDDLIIHNNVHSAKKFVIPDSREGWIDSVRRLINSYVIPHHAKPDFDYSAIRLAGEPISTFGGIASGPEPLMQFHDKIRYFFQQFKQNHDSVLLKTDLMNTLGCMVVSGNVRRSAELASLSINDPTFINLKDYELYPERQKWGWMSNNAVDLEKDEDFLQLGLISHRVIVRGEPGFKNLRNFKHGRIGKRNKKLKLDSARFCNPCGEIPLCSHELCNVAEECPSNCENEDRFLKSCEYSTFYCSNVALLPTHHEKTNKIIAKNRRIGVGLVDFIGWKDQVGMHNVIRLMRKGYKVIRKTNKYLAAEAGIPESIRVTCVKPGGSVPKLPGLTSGIGYPSFKYMIRRIRIQQYTPIYNLLIEANIPHEPDVVSANTEVFEFPVWSGLSKTADKASLWEQAFNLVTVQREWADNAVSNTLMFRPQWELIEHHFDNYLANAHKYLDWDDATDLINNGLEAYKGNHKLIFDGLNGLKIFKRNPNHEENDIESVLSMIAPLTKSVSLLPHTSQGVYKQMPEEEITKEEYQKRLAAIKPINWSQLSGSDGEDEKYCQGISCEISG